MNGPDLLFPTAQALVALMADTARKDGLPRRAAYTARHGVLCTTVADLAGVSAAEADAALAKPDAAGHAERHHNPDRRSHRMPPARTQHMHMQPPEHMTAPVPASTTQK